MSQKERYALKVRGIVQGVGFRPYIFKLATEHKLTGWVVNTTEGVSLEIEGDAEYCRLFMADLRDRAPELARIDEVSVSQMEAKDDDAFVILPSILGDRNTLIPADMGICEACLADIRNPADRRYQYPFTNCTNCGPRFTIIKDIPYDRCHTSMSEFPLCDACENEFWDPLDRRFHDQPNACPICGPQLAYYDRQGKVIAGNPIELARTDIEAGKVIAVKGLGGYHLVCDARNENAVKLLRERKLRQNKPFAVMMPNMETVAKYCFCSSSEKQLLTSQRRPIVLLQKNINCNKLADSVAPGNNRLGVMLPYTPLHYILIDGFEALVMTSANYSDEPIVYQNEEYNKLSQLIDARLGHNRKILHRCDDSVMACSDYGQPIFIRRSRGFVPEPLPINKCEKNILAVGAEQKNTFALSKNGQAFLSQHIGDLDDTGVLEWYNKEIQFFAKLFNCEPDCVAYDMHPQYLSTRYALKTYADKLLLPVQHHHAHFAAVLAEQQINEPAIGLIYDGTGYGTDGALWGGEIFTGTVADCKRAGHLAYQPLPGGEKAIMEPWRMAMSYLLSLYSAENIESIAPKGLLPENWPILQQAISAGINSPLTSGMGRLFDAVAALIGIGRTVNYEGQAAIDLEQVIDTLADGAYTIELKRQNNEYLWDCSSMFEDILADLRKGVERSIIATRFHRAVIDTSVRICILIRDAQNINNVALAGGCWQNMFLLNGCMKSLSANGFNVLINSAVPANDGGIAYGQSAVAIARINRGDI